MNFEQLIASMETDTQQAFAELDNAQLALVGGGIGETILVTPVKG
jgi:hypothetical protein